MSGDTAPKSSIEKDVQDVNEEALLRALDRLGSRRQNESQKASTVVRRGTSETRRRRFGGERDVVVTHQSLSQHGERKHTQASVDDASAMIDRLKMELRSEQRKSEALSRDVMLAQSQNKAIEAHLMHARLRVQELENTVKQKDARLAVARQELEALSKLSSQVVKSAPIHPASKVSTDVSLRKTRGRKRREEPQLDSSEPEPVRWWKD